MSSFCSTSEPFVGSSNVVTHNWRNTRLWQPNALCVQARVQLNRCTLARVGDQQDLCYSIKAGSSRSRVQRLMCRADTAPDARVADEDYMQEYAQLKSAMLDTTRKTGAAIAAYLLLTAGGASAVCVLVGMGFSNLYLLWLFRDVDNVKPTDFVPMAEANKIQPALRRNIAKWLASYYHALRPRLLVPVILAVLMSVYNRAAEQPLSGLEEAGLLLGFLSYKGALFGRVAADLSPKGYADEPSRPMVEKFDEQLELDRWGRPKKPSITMPTEALPEDVDPNNLPVLPALIAGLDSEAAPRPAAAPTASSGTGSAAQGGEMAGSKK